MRINDRLSQSVDTARTASLSQASENGNAAGKTSGGSGDHIALSSAASLVSRALNSTPSERESLVAMLAAQVRTDQYSLNSSQTSKALVNSLLGD